MSVIARRSTPESENLDFVFAEVMRAFKENREAQKNCELLYRVIRKSKLPPARPALTRRSATDDQPPIMSSGSTSSMP